MAALPFIHVDYDCSHTPWPPLLLYSSWSKDNRTFLEQRVRHHVFYPVSVEVHGKGGDDPAKAGGVLAGNALTQYVTYMDKKRADVRRDCSMK